MFHRAARIFVPLFAAFAVFGSFACLSSEVPAAGTERGACFPNQTCHAGLVCLSLVCVLAPDSGVSTNADAQIADGGTASSDSEASRADSDISSPEDVGSNGGDAGGEDAGSGEDAEFDDATSGDADSTIVEVEIGTGTTPFETIAVDQRMPLVYDRFTGNGRYDSFFIRFSMRAQNLDPFQAQVLFTLRDAATGDLLAQSSGGRFNLASNNPWYELLGSAPRITDCCLALDTPLIMRVEVTDRFGVAGSDERRVRGGLECLNNAGENVCP